MRIIKFCSITTIRRKYPGGKHSKRDISCFINDRDHGLVEKAEELALHTPVKPRRVTPPRSPGRRLARVEIRVNEIKSLSVTPFLSPRAKLVETLLYKS